MGFLHVAIKRQLRKEHVMTQPTPHTPTRRQRLLEKALEEISIGDPEKAETYIELVLADEKGGHTPGPWHVYDATLVYAACGLRIADCDWDGEEDEMLSLETQEQANARLIAAAPDLLLLIFRSGPL
jgi:hypothetical protein